MQSTPLRNTVIGIIPAALLLAAASCAPAPDSGPPGTPAPVAASISAAPEPVAQQDAPSDWTQWAQWLERRYPVADSLGHGPTPGSDEWAMALDRRLGITDKQGHGPDRGSDEWRRAVEFKLSAAQRTAP